MPPHSRPARAAGRTRSASRALEPLPPSPLERLQALATEVASALEFMASRFGPPALPT